MRAGCNTGSCHGAARGKDGFRLSLFGFDPDGDHYRLTREINGRRINLALPAESLLLEKATRQGAAHRRQADQGGRRVLPDAHPLARSRRPARPADRRRCRSSMEVFPPTAVLDGKGEKQRIVVRAKYSDGTDRDVTSLALFLSNNDTVREDRRRRRSSPPASAARRSSWPASHTFTVGVAVHRAAEGPAVRLAERRPRTTTSTRSSTPSSRSCASRRRSCAPTRRSSAACTSTSSACCRRPRSTPGSWPAR